MEKNIPQNLLNLADVCQDSLYIVGGSVRDFLCGYPLKNADWDIASPMKEEELLAAAAKCGFTVQAVFHNTGTVKLKDGAGEGYEFTRFRSDKYVRGLHVPSEITFTRDILSDARRRDFCANAVYYDLKNRTFCDPLGGIGDIEKKCLRTVAPAGKVFGEDGLRLARLARIAAQTGFSPDEECLNGARENRALIKDIVPERIFTELNLLLIADGKHNLPLGPYRGLHILDETGVLELLLPELTRGRGLEQRKEFHQYDVLEHSLRCVRYAPQSIRFAALLHDVGKPFCYFRDGNFYNHPEEGARIANDFLTRLKAPKRLIEETCALILLHMRDYNLEMKENKIRREIAENYPLLPKLFALKQADFSACKDDLSPAPAVTKWNKILTRMQAENAPYAPGMLQISGKMLQEAGIAARDTGTVLKKLLAYALEDGRRNNPETLLAFAKKHFLPQ